MEGRCYRRTIEVAGVIGAIEVSDEPSESRLAMRVSLPSYDGLMEVVQRATRLFDLGADALHIGRHLSRDATLAAMVAERPGLRVPGVWDGFELAVRAVLGQQLTVVDSPALVERLVQTFGEPTDVPAPGLSRLFPKPGILAEANLADLGIPRQRAETIASLARAVLARKVAFDSYRGLRGILAALRLLPNMDENIVSYIAMRSVGEPDALSYADIGLRRALGAGRRTASPAEVLRTFEKFRPWRAYAAMYLWTATEQAERRIRWHPSSYARTRRIGSRLPLAAV